MSDTWGKVSTLASGDHARGCQGRSYTCECGHDDAIQGALSFAKVEITRLQAERIDWLKASYQLNTQLAEARDKALDEAAWACDNHRYGDSFLDSCHLRKEHRQDITQAIRALKSPKPPIL